MGLVLDVEGLYVTYHTPDGDIPAVRDLSFGLNEGEILGIVGESGSGKSTLALALAGLLPRNAYVGAKKIVILNSNIDAASLRKALEDLRGVGIFMVFQDPFSSLNPLIRIREQLAEAYITRVKRTKGIRMSINDVDDGELINYLKRVNIPDPEVTLYRYPHQLSGGQIQRVMIAMALILEPRILIADEPTTALDVITQIQVLHELKKLVDDIRTSIIFITHDIALASTISDRLAVMYGGYFMEVGNTLDVLKEPLHPYTMGLVTSIPSKRKHEGYLPEIKGVYVPTKSKGCPFWPRCPYTKEACMKEVPELKEVKGRLVRCFMYE
ncbi:ABC transporter ATP-binding protein [Vulcanisaeta souniana]|uniref:ABC transporter ATP-binding protein n=1 Tax=Vulcanisaeta souniana JCM 11219 TaxID=1293586 RepID=A0A830E448_9CREN|nr:ABC transporter ATP-binding protein [Vulcanisaeta souniana]BDR91028.1 ABC transporter ATP-binding protein [Vulcanisaeta souniana JCM 11219]GGI80131.1 ABC transporter ATP-binding protein [Vulcanisaeta souniana JCM 11219]